MPEPVEIRLDDRLDHRAVAAVARGARLTLGPGARTRIAAAQRIVEAIVERGLRVYGVSTGVGALCDTVVDRKSQAALSRAIVMSHACGVGAPLGRAETRAIMAAQIVNFAHGVSGVRLEVVDTLLALLNADALPPVPAGGSVGYVSHAAAIALAAIGCGEVRIGGAPRQAAAVLAELGLPPLVLRAKEGLSLVGGMPCASGLASLALARLEHLLDWADAIAATTFEALGGQLSAFDAGTLALRISPGIAEVGATLRARLSDSALLAAASGRRTQDALSLRAIPQVHGAVRDIVRRAVDVVDRDLASATDNPALAGTPDDPVIHAHAHPVGTELGLTMDGLAVAVAQLGAIAERRIDRLVNPLVSGLPAFLAARGDVGSGFMIAQYTAAALVAGNRRLAAPASLDGGITSALQEDMLAHATPAALRVLSILDNLEHILAIELLAALQAHDLGGAPEPAAATRVLREAVRARVPLYDDDRPLGADIERARAMLAAPLPMAG